MRACAGTAQDSSAALAHPLNLRERAAGVAIGLGFHPTMTVGSVGGCPPVAGCAVESESRVAVQSSPVQLVTILRAEGRDTMARV
mmetsp:Transcript_10101/g.26196  ORF Transcript_10101/g.26196 Transcript_10101/m.26196 type:complete len:85 (-) Transcript_10101:974-1228(-)